MLLLRTEGLAPPRAAAAAVVLVKRAGRLLADLDQARELAAATASRVTGALALTP